MLQSVFSVVSFQMLQKHLDGKEEMNVQSVMINQ